jgi:hypothetical protein
MSKRALISILLLPAMVMAWGVATRYDQVLNFILGPVDDPQYFCGTPDPSPLADLGTTIVLQECSAGKTVTIKRGERIAVDLRHDQCVDMCSVWHDLGVSDQSVLGAVVAPTRRDSHFRSGSGITSVSRDRSDEIAVYRALITGRSSISAVQVVCGGIGGACGRDHRWKVTVQVR